MLLKALVKSNGNLITIDFKSDKSDSYRYRDSWNSENFWKRAIKKEAKNWYQKEWKDDYEW